MEIEIEKERERDGRRNVGGFVQIEKMSKLALETTKEEKKGGRRRSEMHNNASISIQSGSIKRETLLEVRWKKRGKEKKSSAKSFGRKNDIFFLPRVEGRKRRRRKRQNLLRGGGRGEGSDGKLLTVAVMFFLGCRKMQPEFCVLFADAFIALPPQGEEGGAERSKVTPTTTKTTSCELLRFWGWNGRNSNITIPSWGEREKERRGRE